MWDFHFLKMYTTQDKINMLDDLKKDLIHNQILKGVILIQKCVIQIFFNC